MTIAMKIFRLLIHIILMPIYYLKWKNSKIPEIPDKTIAESFQLPHEICPEIPFWEKGDKLEAPDNTLLTDIFFVCIDEKGVVTGEEWLKRHHVQNSIRWLMRVGYINRSLKDRNIKKGITNQNKDYQEYLDDYKIGYNMAKKI